MQFQNVKRWLAAGATVLTLVAASSAFSQRAAHKFEPYYETMLPISQAFGIEMLDARLRVAEAYTTPINADLKVQLGNMATKDLGRFYGTLQQKNAALATELKTAVDAVVRAINDGQPAAALAARARPLVANAYNLVIDPALRNDLPYDARRQLAPIVQLVETISVAVVNPAFPVRSFAELVAEARRSGIYAAVPGTGSIPHLAAVQMNRTLGTKFESIHYRGTAPALVDVLANQVPAMFTNLVSVMSQIRAGQLRALAILGPERAAGLPDVPSVAETGHPEAAVPTMTGLFAPAGTPAGVIDYVNRAANAVLAEPQVREHLETVGFRVVGGSPAEFAATYAAMHDHYTRLIREAGIKAAN